MKTAFHFTDWFIIFFYSIGMW